MNSLTLERKAINKAMDIDEARTAITKKYYRVSLKMNIFFFVFIILPPLESWAYDIFYIGSIVWFYLLASYDFSDEYSYRNTCNIFDTPPSGFNNVTLFRSDRRIFYVVVWGLSIVLMIFTLLADIIQNQTLLTKGSLNILSVFWIIFNTRAYYTLRREYKDAITLINIKYHCYKHPEEVENW